MFGTVKFHPMYYDTSERLNSTPKWNFGLQMTVMTRGISKQMTEDGDNMIDSHIHLYCKRYNQTFPYIGYDGIKFTIASDGWRDALID